MAPFCTLPRAIRAGLILALAVCAASASAQPRLSGALNDAGASPSQVASLAASVRAAVEEAKLVPDGATAADDVGHGVSLSGDRALVGAPSDDGGGKAYVFVRSGTTWTLEATLMASDRASGAFFGITVSLSGDRALVGATGDDGAATDAGAAYVFVRSGTTWTEEAKLTLADAEVSDALGASLSLEGDRALVGAPTGFGSGTGAAHVFVRSGTAWTEEAELTASDGAVGDGFGASVSLSGDRALVGAASKDSFRGAVYVFARAGGSWTEEARLVASDGDPDDEFGSSVSLSGDRALIGAAFDSQALTFDGSAYVFARSGGEWTEEATLTPSVPMERAFFGTAVSLSGDRALIGASGEEAFRGAAYVFERSGATWTQEARLVPGDGVADDFFGEDVSLAGDRALVGASAPGSEATGAAYVYADLGPVATAPGVVPASALSGPRPNPAAGRTSFVLTLDAPQPIRASLFDGLGRKVGVLFDGMARSETRFDVDTAALPPGVYLVRVAGVGLAETRRLTVVR